MFDKRPSKVTRFAKLGITILLVCLCAILAADIAEWRIVPYASLTATSSITPCPTGQIPLEVLSRDDIPIVPVVPTYPNAEDLQVKTIPESVDNPAGTPYLGGAYTTKITTFKTHDTPESIQNFYSEALRKTGWDPHKQTLAPNELEFYWIPFTQEAKIWEGVPCAPTPPCCQPTYLLRLIVTQTSTGTEVELRGGYWPGV